MSTRLTRSSVPAGLLTLPERPSATGIVHLGLGNFHRAHQAVYTAAAARGATSEWGILGVASRSAAVVDALVPQDLLYAVREVSPLGTSITVPGVHTGAIVAAQDPAAVVGAIGDEATRIVSITVTEHGYHIDPATGLLATASQAIAADLAGVPPRTTIGQIARGLERRALGHGRPVTIQSCDNLEANGTQTRRLIFEFLEASGASSSTQQWVEEHVTFPNSVVDRIVPSTSDADRAAVLAAAGLVDESPVPAEPFSMWVMEDQFAAGRPDWDRAGAMFSDEVAAYELVKLRLLNGTHSLIAYLGALDGRATIAESRNQDFIARAADAVLRQEYLPSITLPAGFDADAYIASLVDRWSNSALGHRTQQVGSDGSVKLQQRFPEPALRLLRQGRMPEHIALTVAAYLCCVAPLDGFDPGPHARAMVDPARPRLAELAAGAGNPAEFVEAVFTRGQVFSAELAAQQDLLDRISEYVAVICQDGIRAAAALAGRSFTGSEAS